MSKQKLGGTWTAAHLRRRGWTNELMRQLLPAPILFMNGGHPVRLWNRDIVREAENDPRFEQQGLEPRAHQAAAPGVRHARALLSQAWDGADRDGSPAWLLAGYYHSALMARLPAAAKGRSLPPAQAAAWMNEFLALEQRENAGGAPAAMKNFLKAGAWLGASSDHPLAREVLDRYPQVLLSAARQAAAEFTAAQPEADLEAMLGMEDFPVPLLFREGLATVWSVWYVPQAIRTSLSLLIALNPKDEYPEARAMRRRFVLHLGGTNTGKTYAGFQRLKSAETGVYLAPLRLLALEAQETLLDAGVDCGLSTGEEEDLREEDTHVAATAEKLDLKRRWDVAVIDECQMIADRQRGYAWTRAILGVLAPEIHLCAAPEARDLLLRLIESCGDVCEVELHQRDRKSVV